MIGHRRVSIMAHFSWWLLAMVLIALVSLAEWVLASWAVLVPAAAAAAAAYLLGRRHGARRAGCRWGNRAVDAVRLDALRGQVAEGEALAVVIESCRAIQHRYGTGARS